MAKKVKSCSSIFFKAFCPCFSHFEIKWEYSKSPQSAPPQSADPASLRLVLWSTTPHSAVNLRIFSLIHICYFASKLNKSTKHTFESCFKMKENSKTYIWQVFTIMNCFKKLQKWNKSAKHTFERHLSVMNCFRKLQNIHITSFFTCLKSKQIHKTYIWQVFNDERNIHLTGFSSSWNVLENKVSNLKPQNIHLTGFS